MVEVGEVVRLVANDVTGKVATTSHWSPPVQIYPRDILLPFINLT